MCATGDPANILIPPRERAVLRMRDFNFLALGHQLVLVFMDPGRVRARCFSVDKAS